MIPLNCGNGRFLCCAEGPRISGRIWFVAMFAPGKTPPDVVDKLADAMHKVIANPDFRARVEKTGAHPVGNSPAEFKAQILREVEQTKKLVKERNIKFE